MNEKIPTILMVDDDKDICQLTAEYLKKHGLEVQVAHDVPSALKIFQQQSFDLAILDIMLPGESGIELCKQIHQDSNIPIIMLTAIEEDVERVVALEIGADDYITKPFNLRVLLAQVRALLRRVALMTTNTPEQIPQVVGQTRACYKFANWRFDLNMQQLISIDDVHIELSSAERDLLLVFIQHPQRVLSREQLLDYTKRNLSGPFDRSIDVLISRIRQKIESDPKHPQLIKTLRNLGYIFDTHVTKEN